MEKLYWMSGAAGIVGVLTCLIAWLSWPKGTIFRAADPSANIAWLGVGGALIGYALIALLFAIHAESVDQSIRRALEVERLNAKRGTV